jgi:hypothetical protein
MKKPSLPLIRVTVAAVAVAAVLTCPRLVSAQGFYNIAHMTNKPEAVDWALGEGANAVEADLQFDGTGNPTVFNHGGLCDCSCLILKPYGICKAMDSPCGMSSPAADLLAHIATKSAIALTIIDSKMSSSASAAKQKQAGSEVGKLLKEKLFDKGYKGKVIVSVADADNIEYLRAVVVAMNATNFKARVYYTIDQENDVVPVLEKLIGLPTQNRVYATGSSACSPTQFFDDVALAAKNRASGVIGLTYNWTIDSKSSMEKYLGKGTNGMMTNDPKELAALLTSKGIALAGPNSPIPAATSATIIKQ